MEARLRRLNLSHYAATLRGHEIDDDILKLMTVADLREAGLDATAAQRLHADVSGIAAPPGLAPPPGLSAPPGFSTPSPRALAALGFDSATSQSAPMPLADAPPPPGFQPAPRGPRALGIATGATTSPWGSRESSPRAAAEEPWSSRPPVLAHASTTSVAHDEDDDDDEDEDAFAGFLPSDLLDDDDDDADAAVVARVAGASKAVADLDPTLRLAVQLVLAVSVVESIRRLVAIAGEALVALALGAGYVLYRRGRARAAPLPVVCAVLAGKARSAIDDSTFHAVIAQLLALLCAAACWWLATRPRKKRRRRPPVIKQKSADDWNVATGAASNAPKRKKRKGKTPRAKPRAAPAPAPEPAPKPEPEPEPEPEQPEPEAAPRRRNQRSRQAPDPRLAAALFGGR